MTRAPKRSRQAPDRPSAARAQAHLGHLHEELEAERRFHETFADSQRELEASRERYARLYDLAPVGYLTLDDRQLVREANLTAVGMLGAERAAVIGRPLYVFMTQPDRRTVLGVFTALRRGASHGLASVTLSGRDSTPLVVELWVVRADAEQAPADHYRYYAVLTDITKRREAEHAALAADANYRIVADHTYNWEFWIGPGGGFRYSSPSCERITGHTAEEFLADPSLRGRLIHPADRRRFLAHLDDVESRHSVGEGEWRFVVPDGTCRWVAHSCQPVFDAAGRYLGVRGSNREVTKRKEAEEALRRMNEMLEQRVADRTAEVRQLADRLRALASELTQTEQRERRRLATVLHDHIQQLLVGARFQLSLVGKYGDPALIQSTVERVDRILADSLTAARSLTIELSPPVLHQAGLAAALLWLSDWMRERQQFQLRVRASANAEPAAAESRAFTFDAVRELLLNVIKHSGVREATVTMERARENTCMIVVDDRGRGFDPNAVEPSRLGGFGLFSIEQRLMGLGGSLQIATAPGRGTRASISLPIGGEPFPDAPDRSESKPGGGTPRGEEPARLRVVLADDHQIVRQGLSSLIRFEGDIEVVGEAEDGRQAVYLARQLKPDVVVMDVSMPIMDGVEATSLIRREMPEVAVIGLSMRDDPEAARAMRQAGAVTYLTKGGPAGDLLEAIRACGRASE